MIVLRLTVMYSLNNIHYTCITNSIPSTHVAVLIRVWQLKLCKLQKYIFLLQYLIYFNYSVKNLNFVSLRIAYDTYWYKSVAKS